MLKVKQETLHSERPLRQPRSTCRRMSTTRIRLVPPPAPPSADPELVDDRIRCRKLLHKLNVALEVRGHASFLAGHVPPCIFP